MLCELPLGCVGSQQGLTGSLAVSVLVVLSSSVLL